MPTLPSQNPFEGLFGGAQSKSTLNLPTSSQIRENKNPFSGLFEAQKTQAPTVEDVIPEEIKSRNEVIKTYEEPGFFGKIVNKAFDVLGFNKAAPIASEKQKKEVSDFVYNEMKQDPIASNPVLGIIKDTFIPTKIILAGQSPYVSEAQKRINAEFETEHPIVSIVPKVVAGVANLLLIGRSGGGFGLSGKIAETAGGLGRLYPTATRILGLGAESGSIFGIESFVSEALNQAQKRKLDIGELAKETGKGTAAGIALGGAGALPTLAGRTAAGAGVMGTLATAESFFDDKKIDSKDLTNIAVNTLLGAGFELMGGRQKSKLFKEAEMRSIASELPIARIMSNNPNMKRAEAEKLAGLIDYLSTITKSDIAMYETVSADVRSNFAGLPAEYWNWPRQKQGEYFNKVSSAVLAGKNIPQSIESANLALGVKSTLYDRQKELQNLANTPAGQKDENLIKELAEVNEAIATQQKMSSENVLTIKKSDGGDYLKIDILPIANQWGYSYEIDTTDASFSSGFLSNELKKTKEEAIAAAKNDVLAWAQKELADQPSPESETQLKEILDQTEKINPALGVPVEARPASYTTDQIDKNVLFYKQMGISHEGDIQPENAALRDLATLSETTQGKKYAQDRLSAAIERGDVKKNEDGTITVWRSGNVPKESRLTSITWDKEFAESFAPDRQLKDREVRQFTIRPEDVKVFIGGGEKELLVASETLQGKTQKEKVAEAVKEKPKSVKEVAAETKILEPNVRRILGVGAKEGTFERVDKGVYILKKDGKQLAYIETGDAVEVLPRLVKEGFKADMVFLDIPYKTPAVIGGNRGIKYEYITTEQFKTVVDAVKEITRYDETPVFYMFSQAKSGEKEMQKYTDTMIEAGFKPVARGEYTKLQKDGITRVRNMRGNVIEPEGIILFTKSGVTNMVNPNLNFKLVRPKGYQTEKPAEMLRALIEMSTKEGEVVLDPFAGSGVTGEQAIEAGRETVAIEKSEKAVEEHIKPRFAKAAEKVAEKPTPAPKIAKPKAEIKIGKKVVAAHEVAGKIMDKRPSLPILGEFRVKDGKLAATNLEMAITLNSDLPDGMYKLVGKDAVKTSTDPADFPIMPDVKGDLAFTALTENFSKTIKQALPSIGDAEARPELMGISLKNERGQIIVASTDGYRLFIKGVSGKIQGNFEAIITGASVKKIEKVVGSLGSKFGATFDKNFVKFSGDNGELLGRLIEGKYPQYKQIMPAFEKRYTFDKKELADALKELKPFAGKMQPTVQITFADGKAKMHSDSKLDYSSNEKDLVKDVEIPMQVQSVQVNERSLNDGVLIMPIKSDNKKLWLNIDFIKDALGTIEGDRVYLYTPADPTTRPSFFSEKYDLISETTGTPKTIARGVKLFHGTTKDAAASIIKKGFEPSTDETATYGKAVYLTPDYRTAQDYADQEDSGQVVSVKTSGELNLYEPTKAERMEMIDKIGREQEIYIRSLLGDEYDGLYIPDDGQGDGGEQVVLYTDKKVLAKATLADEVKNDESKVVPKKRLPAGIGSAGADKLGNFEDLAGVENKTPEQMKIFEEVKALIAKYAKTIGEGYMPRNLLGVYYPNTENIRISGMNHLSVAAHEITHLLDFAYKISEQLMGIKGYSASGQPIYDRATAPLRKELTNIYEKYYPGGKRTHKLKKRMLEGFATLLEKYTEQPSSITAEFPNAVKQFLTSEGLFYKPVIGDIIQDLRAIVAKYQGLSALDKIGARVINNQVNVNKDSFLNFWQKVKTEIADNVYPIEVLAKKAGVHFTKRDPSLWVRQYNNSNALILNNINGNRGYWAWRNGEIVKLHDFNWKDLIKDIKKDKSADAFGSYLVARNEYFLYQELAKMDPQSVEYQKLKKILDADGFTQKEVEDAYLENKDRFAEMEKKFDLLTREDLNFLNDPQVQLLNGEDYARLTSREGYASMKRYFYDEVAGEEEAPITRVRFGTTKVSSMIKRTGSQKPIINPLFSALKNHAEITRKGLKQIVYNRIAGVSSKFPAQFQRLQLQGIPDRQGKIMFPQEKDPQIIMARVDYKRVPILTDATIKRAIDEVLNFQNITIAEKFLLAASRFFTKGTTGLFPGFALTNTAVDQITAAAQTRNKFIPVYDQLANIFQMLDPNHAQHVYLQEYLIMGGEKQTFVGWQDMAPNELFERISKERAGLLKVVDALNTGMNVLALPAQWSEIMTRATEYIKARQAGKTPIVALEEAGRVTAPFHHIGRLGGARFGQTFIKSIPFFNPGIQVLAQAAETLETPAGRARYSFVNLLVVAASIAGFGLILAAGTEEQKQLYADINPDELNKYIWLPNIDGKSLIKIRVPDQMAVFATLFNMILSDTKLDANYTAGEYLAAATSWLPAQFNITEPVKMFMAWIPQLIKPGVLTIAGVKDFPKIMPLESQMLANRSPEFRYNESTSPGAKLLGRLLNMSPIKIDYLLTGYAGRASGFLTGKPGIYNPFKSMSREYYFTSGRQVQKYYDLKEENDQLYNDYKNKRREFKVGERTQILRERTKLNSIGDLISEFRDLDVEKKPDRAEYLRNKILDKISEL